MTLYAIQCVTLCLQYSSPLEKVNLPLIVRLRPKATKFFMRKTIQRWVSFFYHVEYDVLVLIDREKQ